ncbi:MAG: hypothetical protein ACRBI6_15470 [Acidimicrobiales bacterium]
MEKMFDTVERFYECLGSRNWIFHESLSLDQMEGILEAADSSEAAERMLVEYYQNLLKDEGAVHRLRGHEGLRVRMGQLRRAQLHFNNSHFDSCAMQLIAVMDGFVNDQDPSRRQGLAARDADDMTAWDSVVGHHMGLTHALKTFTKTVKKRNDDEVFELYRHGLVHGSITSFDNPVVASKAWNMLFAVADWASDMACPPEPEETPSIRDSISKIASLSRDKKARDAFVAYELDLESLSPSDQDGVSQVRHFLQAWQAGRWSEVADFQPRKLRGNRRPGELAKEAKSMLSSYELGEYRIASIDRDTPSTLRVVIDRIPEADTAVVRFINLREDASQALPEEGSSTWEVCVWSPRVWFRNAA